MTLSVKHAFTSAKGDSGDPTLIQPSNWNAEHTITAASGKVLGRDTSSAGAIQELPIAVDPTGQSVVLPSGTTAQRPISPVLGMKRFNTTTGLNEQYLSTGWASIGVPDDGSVTLAKLAAVMQAALCPAGMLAPFAGTAAPTGWLLCAGQAVSRTTYASLFSAIGILYGAGDGSTTFALPDLRGRVVAGKDDMNGSAASRLTAIVTGSTLGAAAGTETVSLTAAQLAAHTHSGTTGTDSPDHSHGMTLGTMSGYDGPYHALWGNGDGIATTDTNNTGGASARHAHGFTTDGGAGLAGSAHSNLQPTIVQNYMIKY